jgi:hypothetical protein
LVGPITVAIAPQGQPGGPQHITIRLDPAELGRVQVRIERAEDGTAKVDLAVERTDTLLLLLRDQPQLHRALDLAGVPPEGRVVQFSLAPPDAPGGGAGLPMDSGGGSGNRPGQGRSQGHGDHQGGGQSPGQAFTRRRVAWASAGIDITA